MKMLKIVSGIAGVLFLSSSYAGLYSITHASIANCWGTNESVSWYNGHPFLGRVESVHYETGRLDLSTYTSKQHKVGSPVLISWKHRAAHPGEATTGNYSVMGIHYIYSGHREIVAQVTKTVDCQQYDGWNY